VRRCQGRSIRNQSGFQLTVEPSGFQPVVVQFREVSAEYIAKAGEGQTWKMAIRKDKAIFQV
jgi:hypothetical protein